MKTDSITKKDLAVDMVPYPKAYVEAIDTLIAFANKQGSNSRVETSADWKTMEFIYKIFSIVWPEDEALFIRSMKEFRAVENKHGIGKGEDGALIQHSLEVPEKFHALVRVIFPDQKWDTVFCRSLAKALPQLKPINDRL